MSLIPDTDSSVTAIASWLDEDRIAQLLTHVIAGDEPAARACIESAGMRVFSNFSLSDARYRASLQRALEARLADEEDQDTATTRVPDYAKFAADLRNDE